MDPSPPGESDVRGVEHAQLGPPCGERVDYLRGLVPAPTENHGDGGVDLYGQKVQ